MSAERKIGDSASPQEQGLKRVGVLGRTTPDNPFRVIAEYRDGRFIPVDRNIPVGEREQPSSTTTSEVV